MHQVRRTGAERCRVRTEAAREAARKGGVQLLREQLGSEVRGEGAQGEGAERSSEGQSQAAGARSADILAQTVSKRGSAHRTASTRFGLASSSALSRSVSPLCAASTTSFASSAAFTLAASCIWATLHKTTSNGHKPVCVQHQHRR